MTETLKILGSKPFLKSSYRSYVYPCYAGECEAVYNNTKCARAACGASKPLATETTVCAACIDLPCCDDCGDFAEECTCTIWYGQYGDEEDYDGSYEDRGCPWIGSSEQKAERQQMGICG